MGGVLVSCVLGMGVSPVAWAVQVTDVKGPAPTAADDARLKANVDALAKKLEQITAVFGAPAPGVATANLNAKFANQGDGTFLTTRMLAEHEISNISSALEAVGGIPAIVPAVKSFADNVRNTLVGIARFEKQFDSRGDYIAESLGGGASVQQDIDAPVNTPINDVLKLPTFQAARVDVNGNALASPATSNNVADALMTVGESVKNTANASVKYDDASNKAQLTLNPGGQAARLSNVQAGALTASSTDAVNGSQLSSSNERIGQLGTQLGELATRTGNDIAAAKAYTDANVVTVRQSIEAVQGVATQTAQSVSKVSAEVANLQKGVGGAFQTSARSNLRQPQASGKDAMAGGGAAQAAGDNSVAMGARARAEGSDTTAVGSDAKATASNSVALGANSVADRSNTVSVGQAGAERQITNVAAGSRGTDAANIAQLTRATAAATEQANAYTDQRYAQLHRDLKQQDSTLSAGIAGAMAMANLPRSMVAGGSMTSVAVGNYRGESALAVGVSYVSPSGRWSTNFSGSTNTRNDAGAAVGVGYQW